MERIKKGATLAALMVVVTMALLAQGVKAQNIPSCGASLVPCRLYLNSTSPPESCCGPLKDAVATQLACLCALYNDTQIFKALNINITDALALPKHCGISSDQSACKSTATPSPSETNAPPATPGSDNKNGASRVSWTGLCGLVSLLLFWLSTMA